METQFKVGGTYELSVVGIREENERKFIYLSDGVKETYRVNPYDFQVEWEANLLPKMMRVYVSGLNIMNGLPYLQQVRKDVLEHCYTAIGEEYPFKVLAVEKDDQTKADFYKLRDSFGIEHRYYPKDNEPRREVTDIFSLQVNGTEHKGGNKYFLNLEYIEDKIAVSVQDVVDTPVTVFGREDDFTEFKSTIVYPPGTTSPDIDEQMQHILKVIAGFQNRDGGKLYLGVNDSGNICGINQDFVHLNSSSTARFNNYQANTDGYENKIRISVKHSLGLLSNSSISFQFDSENGLDYCCITVEKVLKPVFVDGIKLFERAGNMTQLLKGDEISWFVEERMLQRNKLQSEGLSLVKQHNVQQIDEQEDIPQEEKSSITPQPVAITLTPQPAQATKEDKVWFYISFYKNGEWSYQDKALNSDEVVFELPIMNSLKKERLVMAYSNGCINVVNPYDIICPLNAKGRRRYRTLGQRYLNGWNVQSEIVNMFNVSENDLLVIESEDSEAKNYIKIHNVSAVSVHGNLNAEGNVLVNKRFNAQLTRASILSGDYRNSFSSLILKDYQTSQVIGFDVNDRNIQNNLNALRRVLDEKKAA